MNAKKRRKIMICAFTLYCVALLYLLFHRTPMAERSMNYKLFATIGNQWRLLLRDDPLALALRPNSVINLLGNVAVFVPLGVFLPYFFKKQRSFVIFLLTVTLLICAVELSQYLTRLGAMDIDDLILNVLGASIGFLLWRLLKIKK